MNRFINNIAFVVSLLVFSCVFQACTSEENSVGVSQGYIDIRADVDARFAMPDGSYYSLDAECVPEADSLQLTLVNDSYSYTWSSLAQFASRYQSFQAGEYTATLSGRCDDASPSFGGSSSFVLSGGERVSIDVTVLPSEALLALSHSAPGVNNITVFSEKTGFFTVNSADTIAFKSPGVTRFYAQLSDDSGRQVLIALSESVKTEAAKGTVLSVEGDDEALDVTLNGVKSRLALIPAMFDGMGPTVDAQGFDPSESLSVVEGLSLEQSVVMTGHAGSMPLAHVWVACSSEAFGDAVSRQMSLDLLEMSPEMDAFVKNVGFEYSVSDDRTTVSADFTHLIERLASLTSAQSQFSMLLVDEVGRCSEPMVLDVSTYVMSVNVQSVADAVTGVDLSTISVSTAYANVEEADFEIFALNTDDTYSLPCPIVAWESDPEDACKFAFTVELPEGTDNVPLSIRYLGMERATAVVKRVNPDVKCEVDPFATSALITFSDVAELSDSTLRTQAIERITRQTQFYVEGVPASIWMRSPAVGAVVINSLTPDKSYKISALLSGSKPLVEMSFNTEIAEPVPSGDFTDWKTVIEYKNLPCGGRFSATSAPIVNRQNFTDVIVNWTKDDWANQNAKTFCKTSTNHNSWYMQPTAWIESLEGLDNKAICVRSAGWDHDGEAIADYVQSEDNILDYSAVVPNVRQRSAGRFWLGSYTYNASTDREIIDEGVPFVSRPSSLNGYFKYIPDLTDGNDYGVAVVSLVARDADGTETLIADGSTEFRTSTDYRVFNISLDYKVYNRKPTHLKIMFLSSHYGLDGDDSDVPLTPLSAYGRMSGSALWINDLTFSY